MNIIRLKFKLRLMTMVVVWGKSARKLTGTRVTSKEAIMIVKV